MVIHYINYLFIIYVVTFKSLTHELAAVYNWKRINNTKFVTTTTTTKFVYQKDIFNRLQVLFRKCNIIMYSLKVINSELDSIIPLNSVLL